MQKMFKEENKTRSFEQLANSLMLDNPGCLRDVFPRIRGACNSHVPTNEPIADLVC